MFHKGCLHHEVKINQATTPRFKGNTDRLLFSRHGKAVLQSLYSMHVGTVVPASKHLIV